MQISCWLTAHVGGLIHSSLPHQMLSPSRKSKPTNFLPQLTGIIFLSSWHLKVFLLIANISTFFFSQKQQTHLLISDQEQLVSTKAATTNSPLNTILSFIIVQVLATGWFIVIHLILDKVWGRGVLDIIHQSHYTHTSRFPSKY